MTVPGKYLRASPITPDEIEVIFRAAGGVKVIGGPIRLGFSKEGGKAAKGTEGGIDLEGAVACQNGYRGFCLRSFRGTEREWLEHRHSFQA